MYVCIMRQCFGVGTSYGSWLRLTIPAYGWDVTVYVITPDMISSCVAIHEGLKLIDLKCN
jgi:hypothetical protein